MSRLCLYPKRMKEFKTTRLCCQMTKAHRHMYEGVRFKGTATYASAVGILSTIVHKIWMTGELLCHCVTLCSSFWNLCQALTQNQKWFVLYPQHTHAKCIISLSYPLYVNLVLQLLFIVAQILYRIQYTPDWTWQFPTYWDSIYPVSYGIVLYQIHVTYRTRQYVSSHMCVCGASIFKN